MNNKTEDQSKRVATTIYLSEKDRSMINKLMAKYFAIGEKTSMSDIISNAIKDTYEKKTYNSKKD